MSGEYLADSGPYVLDRLGRLWARSEIAVHYLGPIETARVPVALAADRARLMARWLDRFHTRPHEHESEARVGP